MEQTTAESATSEKETLTAARIAHLAQIGEARAGRERA